MVRFLTQTKPYILKLGSHNGTQNLTHTHTHTHTLPGSGTFSGSGLVYQRCQSRGYCSNEAMSPWKLVSLSSSVMLSQLESDSQLEQGLSICFSLSRTYHTHTHTLQISFCNMRTFFFKQLKTNFSKNPLSEPEHTHKPSPPCCSHQSPPEKEAVFINIELPGHLQDLGAHVETEQELVTLKQSSTGVSTNRSNSLTSL